MKRSFPLLALLLVTFGVPRGARAGDVALAEALFREGRALMDQKQYAEACPRLAESFNQDPATGTLLALALCQEQAGRTASAWASFAEVVTRAKHDGNTAREQAAREHLAALEPRLSRLIVDVDAASRALPGLVVTRDGTPVGEGAWGAPGPVDPGTHVVSATAPGRAEWHTEVTIGASGEARTVVVPALTAAPADAPAPAAAPAAPPPAAAPAPVTAVPPPTSAPPAAADAGTSGSSAVRTTGLVVGGAGLVTLGVSAFFGLRATSLNTDSKKDGHCDANDACDPTGLAARADAVSAARNATITLVAGSVLTAAGITLFLVGGPESAAAGTQVGVSPRVAPGLAAMALHGRF